MDSESGRIATRIVEINKKIDIYLKFYEVITGDWKLGNGDWKISNSFSF